MPDPVFSGVGSGGISKHFNVGINVKLENFCNLNDGIGFTNRAFYSIIAANILIRSILICKRYDSCNALCSSMTLTLRHT